MQGGAEAFDPQREFIREITVRLERASRAVVGELAAMRGELGGMRGEIGDLRDETRAQTRALLRMIDRLEGGEAPAT